MALVLCSCREADQFHFSFKPLAQEHLQCQLMIKKPWQLIEGKHYLDASSLIIRTNQQSLKYIQEQKLTDGIQHKLLVKLLGHDFTIEYKQGNKHSDALSRIRCKIHTLIACSAKPAWISEVVASYKNDLKCKDLLVQLTTSPRTVLNYTLQQDVLRYKNRIVIGTDTALRIKLVPALHNSEFVATLYPGPNI